MTKEHNQRIKMLRDFKENRQQYPYLNKVLNGNTLPRLKKFLKLADGREIDKNTLIHDGKFPYFTLPISELKKKYKGGTGTWNRNINLFVALGLIGKVNPFKINSKNALLFQHSRAGKQNLEKKTGIPKEKVKEQNIYYIFPYTEEIFNVAEQRAKLMYDNGFSMGSFSKIYLQRIFGLDFANKVLFNDIEESPFTLAVFEQIENIVITKLRVNHYTYKNEILRNVKIDMDTYRHYENIYKKARITNEWKVAEFEFGRSIKIICNRYDLEYSMSNKKMNALFGLHRNKKIIYDKDYVDRIEKKETKSNE